MQAQHVMVVVAAPPLCDACNVKRGGSPPDWAGYRSKVTLCDLFEWFTESPGPALSSGMDVREYAKDTRSTRWRRRKAVDVQPRVVLSPRRRSPGDFDRPVAGACLLGVRSVRRQEIPDQCAGRCCEAHHHSPQQRQHCLIDLAPSQDSAAWIQTDILRLRSGCSGQQSIFAFLHRETQMRKKQNVARFERDSCALLFSR